MKVAVLTSLLYHECEEINGKDRIIWGGAEKFLLMLCKLLQSMNIDVTVYQSLNQVAPDGRRVPSGNIQKNFNGIPVICLSDTDDDWSYSTNPRLNMVFNEMSIHYHLKIFFATFLCYPFTPNNSISISHGIFWDYPQHFIAHCKPEDKAEFMRRQLYGFTAPDVCVAVDSNVRKVIAALEPGAERNINIIYNFVDTKAFHPVEKTWEGINVLYPRRLTTLRGCNDFIKASQDYPDYNYLAVGQAGDERIEMVAGEWAEGANNIKFTWRPMEEMPEIYQQADIGVVPTKASEGLSLSLLECFACGLPVVTTPVGGIGDAVIPNYNALIYDPNHGGLGECIDFLAKNPDVRKKMGKLNREIAVQSFDIEIWRERWRRLLAQFGVTQQEQRSQVMSKPGLKLITNKTTIAYPPELSWDVMQQRPHHLLKMAANDGLQVYFGDHSVAQSYDVMPNLTLVSMADWNSIKEVDVLYVTRHAQLEHCRGIKYGKLIYDCCDWRDGKDVELIMEADHVLCASKTLYDRASSMRNGGNVIYLPNACEYEHFAKTSDPEEDIVGYMGVVHSTVMDVRLLDVLANNFNLKIIGPFADVKASGKNIHAVGHVHYNDLPEMLSDCKVGVLPFKTDNDWMKGSGPLKVYEYLAAGRPVISTPVPELIPLARAGLIHIVKNDDLEGWVNVVKKAMNEYPNAKGQEWAKNQTWEKRWQKVEGIFN